MTTPTDERKTFCSSKGITLNLKPVSQFKIDSVLNTEQEPIPVPQYQMTIAGGAKVDHPMDEIIAKNQNRMPEWLDYKRQVSARNAENAKRFSDLLFYEGVDIEVPGTESEWQKSMDHFKIKVPGIDDPIGRKLQYIYSELLVGAEDITSLISQILSVSQVSEEIVANMRNSFRVAAQRDTARPARKNKKSVAKPKSDL